MCHDQIIVCIWREATRYLSTIADFPAANAESLLARALLIMRGRQGSLAFLTDYWSGTAGSICRQDQVDIHWGAQAHGQLQFGGKRLRA